MPIADPEPPPVERRTLRIELAPRTIGLLLLVIAGLWLAAQLETVLIVVTIALVMVGTFDPLVAWFERRGIRRGRALVLIFVALALVFAGVLLVTVPPLITQLLHLIEDAPHGRDKLVEWLRPWKLSRPLIQSIKAVPLNDLVVRAGNAMVGYSSQVLTLVGYMISTTFLAIYLLADPVRTKGLIYAVVPRNRHMKLARILIELKVIVGGYMRGQLITSVAIAVFTFALLSAFRVDDALALALFAGMTDIIPFIGGYVASLPVILAVTGSGTGAVIIVIIAMFAYQEFESRVLVPRVYGRVLRLPPAIVLVSLLIGGTLMGIIGALLALPIAAGLQMVVRELRVELPGETPPDATTRARDEKAEHIYERLSEGVTAADAAVIAGELAQKMRQNEITGATLTTAELPAIVADLPGEATEAAVTSSAVRTDGADGRTELTGAAQPPEPTIEPAIDPATAQPPEPTIGPTIDPATAQPPEPTIGPAIEPVIAPAIEPVIAPAIEPVIAPAIDPTIDPATTPATSPKDSLTKDSR